MISINDFAPHTTQLLNIRNHPWVLLPNTDRICKTGSLHDVRIFSQDKKFGNIIFYSRSNHYMNDFCINYPISTLLLEWADPICSTEQITYQFDLLLEELNKFKLFI